MEKKTKKKTKQQVSVSTNQRHNFPGTQVQQQSKQNAKLQSKSNGSNEKFQKTQHVLHQRMNRWTDMGGAEVCGLNISCDKVDEEQVRLISPATNQLWK